MASGTMKVETPRYVEVELGTITIGNGGYTSISQYRPSGIAIVNTSVSTWSTASPAVAFNVNSGGTYIFGTAGMTITGLELRYYY